MLRFAGFEIDRQRSELRGPGGQTIKLRLKAFALLSLLAANPRRIIGKQELMEAVWPGVHVSDDSLFQTIRELRAALGDDKRQLIRAVSGRGYLLEADVSGPPDAAAQSVISHATSSMLHAAQTLNLAMTAIPLTAAVIVVVLFRRRRLPAESL